MSTLRLNPLPVRGLAAAALVLAWSLPTFAQAQQTPATQRMQWYDEHVALAERSLFTVLPWQFLGPTNISGRTTDIAVVEPKGKNYTIYIAGASGGVWKTVNEGVTWEPVFEHAASTSIGDLTLAPSDPQIIWVGTGEANIFRSSMAGSGVYKSIDGGKTWSHMGLAGTHTIPRILIHPQNPDIVYVASSGHEWTANPDRGVFKTTDGGRTWDKVLYIDENTGVIDLVMDPSNSEVLYAASWQRVRKKWHDPRNEPGYTGSGIHKSTDGGRTWTAINDGLPQARYRGRIGIDIVRSQPNVLYAFVDNYEIAREAPAGQLDAYGRQAGPIIKGATVFRSDNGGESWRQTSEANEFMERLSGTYGWVFGQIRADPVNADKIYVMGLNLNVSEDAGKTFRQLRGMHVDHHALWIDPANPDYIVNANDGGVYISYDGGAHWRFMEHIPMVQFFNVAYDMADPFHVYGSIQDHGSRRAIVDLRRGRHNIPAVQWEGAPGGEGSNHAIDPRDPNVVYSAGFYGNISRTNLGTNESVNVTPRPAEGELPFRGQWLAPFMLSPHNPDVIYHGFQLVHRSMDRGDTWERISDDLTHNDPNRRGDIPFQTLFSLVESPLRFGLLYAGSDDGRVHVTRDAGKTWTEITSTLPKDKFIAEIVASAYDEGTVYLAQNGKRDDDFTPYIWKSTDYGGSWTSIVNDVPLGPVNVIKEDPKNRNVLYLGTDVGAYVSVDGGRSWNVLANGLPSTFVADLVIHPRDDILVAATHGRGMYALDVRPIQQLTPQVLAQGLAVLPPEPVRLAPGGGRRGGGGGGFGGAPQARANIHYWLKSPGAVRVTVTDGSGAVMRQLEGTGSAGLNVVEWELPGTPSGRGGRGGGVQADAQGRGGAAGPGVYTVEVRQGDTTVTALVQVSR